MVLLARILQAMGASVIPAAVMIIPIRYFPPERRGRALGVTATGLALGTAIGPILSSLMVTLLHWRWLFCIPFLILFTLPFYRKYLIEAQGKGGRIDWIGGALLAVTVALLLMAVTQGQWLYAAGSLIFFILFILRIRTAAEPFVKAALFRNKGYTIGLLIAASISGIGYSITFLTPKLLSDVHQLASGWIGFVMVPAAITSAILGRKAGKLADQKGNTFLFGLAACLLWSCFVLTSTFSGWHPLWIMGFLIFGNVGQTFMQIALTGAISRTLPQEQTGVGMGLVSLFGFLTMAMSSGIYSTAVEMGDHVRLQTGPVVYSNIYAVLALILVAVLLLFVTAFRHAAPASTADVKGKNSAA
ncbi:MFS transporter [Marinicrinis lubricantis]